MLAIVGNVGTPTAIASLPLVRKHQVPFLSPYSGAGVLRQSPPEKYVFNFRASYAEEIAAMVDALVAYGGLQPQEIAFFTQRDGYGDAGYTSGFTALKRHGLTDERLEFTQPGIAHIIDHYTREAGVRNLERQIAAVCRSTAVKIAEGIEGISRTYRDAGYALVEMVPGTDLDEENRLVDVTINILRGPLVYIERIHVRGNTKTRDAVIRREFRLSEGDLYNQTKLEDGRALVNQLGYFERVDVSEEEGTAANFCCLAPPALQAESDWRGLDAGQHTVVRIELAERAVVRQHAGPYRYVVVLGFVLRLAGRDLGRGRVDVERNDAGHLHFLVKGRP